MENAAGRFGIAQERFWRSVAPPSLDTLSPMDYIHLDGRGASDGGVLGLDAPSQGCQCGRAHCRPHSPHGDGESRRHQRRRSRHLRNAYRLWAGLPDLLCASRSTDCDPVVWWRQAHAIKGYQTGSEAGGDMVMPKTVMPNKTVM